MTAKFGKTFNKKKYCPRLEPKRILTLINLAMLGLGISYLQHADVAQASEIGKVNTYKDANSLKTNQLLELTKNGKTTKEVGLIVKHQNPMILIKEQIVTKLQGYLKKSKSDCRSKNY